jgi:hypothetical protein
MGSFTHLRTASTQLSRFGFLAIFVTAQMAKSASALEQGRKTKLVMGISTNKGGGERKANKEERNENFRGRAHVEPKVTSVSTYPLVIPNISSPTTNPLTSGPTASHNEKKRSSVQFRTIRNEGTALSSIHSKCSNSSLFLSPVITFYDTTAIEADA